MALSDFFRKQFVDVIDWTETEPGVLMYRFPMQDREFDAKKAELLSKIR
jgi:membrane protease subunit (stomatin/prohibitin family)